MNDQRDWRATPLPLNTEGWIRLEDAEDKALRAFWRGLIVGAIMAATLAYAIGAWVAL